MRNAGEWYEFEEYVRKPVFIKTRLTWGAGVMVQLVKFLPSKWRTWVWTPMGKARHGSVSLQLQCWGFDGGYDPKAH